MNNDDINEYLPSLLNPRVVKKQHGDLTLTQNSIVSRCSLSLKRKNAVNTNKVLHKSFPPPGRENIQIKRFFHNSFYDLNTKNVDNNTTDSLNFSLTQRQPVSATGKENSKNDLNSSKNKAVQKQKPVEEASIGFSALEDLNTDKRNNSSSFSIGELLGKGELAPVNETVETVEVNNNGGTLISLSSNTELDDSNAGLDKDSILDVDNTLSTNAYEVAEKGIFSVSFGFVNCEAVNVSTNNSNIKKVAITQKDNAMNIDCQLEESSRATLLSNDDVIELSSEDEGPPRKRNATVNLEIKKKTSTENPQENSKVLILNTNAIERLSHVIVQPPNYKLVKRKIPDRCKFQNNGIRKQELLNNGKLVRGLKQKRIDCFLVRAGRNETVDRGDEVAVTGAENVAMSRISGGAEGVKCDRTSHKASRRETPPSPRARGTHNAPSPRSGFGVKGTASDRNAQRVHADSASSSSPKRHIDSIQLNLPPKATSAKESSPKKIPYHKFVAGTHFAVDAFSYGDIPQVKYYFLTHFHSDHYSGLKKTFNKTLFCSKITAELCTTRLGVNPKCIHIINFDETLTVDGIEVMAVDANHCPGALMLVFTLPNGKTLLHTGDFRASPQMESYPVFWNKDIHTIYLDSTYCNPRYDFPTQEQCLEMALYLLRQKKLTLEKTGKKFSSVLIVCGTYTIGKEKFFMGMARRVGCSVWACPEKDKVLQAVEGRSFGTQQPSACQLHVVPMRDLTHEKLRSYMDSLEGAFTEVVAFKPSGWENGKNSTVEKDGVTIHGIPYSEHSSFSEMIRFVKFLQPKQVVPTVDISGGIKAVQKFFPCPLVGKESSANQSKVTDYFSIQPQQHVPAVT